jgi:hypothetical protein
MAFTAHGHHIFGTVLGDEKPASMARCGGPGPCPQCSREASMNEEAKENLKKAESDSEKIEDPHPGQVGAPNRWGDNPTFQEDLVRLINKHSVENDSGTPDWILAEIMMANLRAWELGIHLRNNWRGDRNDSIFDVTQEKKVRVIDYTNGQRNEIGEAEITMWPGEITKHGGPVMEVVATFGPEPKKGTDEIPKAVEEGFKSNTPFDRYQQRGLSD